MNVRDPGNWWGKMGDREIRGKTKKWGQTGIVSRSQKIEREGGGGIVGETDGKKGPRVQAGIMLEK